MVTDVVGRAVLAAARSPSARRTGRRPPRRPPARGGPGAAGPAGRCLDGDHHHPAAAAHGPRRSPRRAPGSGTRRGDRVRRVELAVRPHGRLDLLRREPVRDLAYAAAGRAGSPPARRRRARPSSRSAPGTRRRCRDGSRPGSCRGRSRPSALACRENVPASSRSSRTSEGRGGPAAGLAWNDDDHLTRRPPAVAARRGAGRAAPAAARPRRARAGRRLRAGHPGPVPGLGGPRARRAGPVHPADPRRRPAHPGSGRRHHLHRRGARHGRPPGRSRRPRPPSGPRWTGCARSSCCTARSTRSRCCRRVDEVSAVPGRAGPAGRGAGPARGRALRGPGEAAPDGAGRAARRPGRSWTGWPPGRRWAACRRARCRRRRSARRTGLLRTRPTAARRPARRCAGWSTTGCWCAARHGRRRSELPREVGLLLRRDTGPLGPAAHQPTAGGRRRRASRRPSTRPAPGRPWRWSGTPRRCWRQLAAEPAPVLRSGGVGRPRPAPAGPDRRAWTSRPTALLLEVAYAAGLLGELDLPGATTSRYGADQQVLPTGGYEVWRADRWPQRWEQLARAWLAMTRQAGLVGPARRPGPADHRALRRGGAGRRAGRPAGGARRCWPTWSRRPRRTAEEVLAPARLAGAAAQPGPGAPPHREVLAEAAQLGRDRARARSPRTGGCCWPT